MVDYQVAVVISYVKGYFEGFRWHAPFDTDAGAVPQAGRAWAVSRGLYPA